MNESNENDLEVSYYGLEYQSEMEKFSKIDDSDCHKNEEGTTTQIQSKYQHLEERNNNNFSDSFEEIIAENMEYINSDEDDCNNTSFEKDENVFNCSLDELMPYDETEGPLEIVGIGISKRANVNAVSGWEKSCTSEHEYVSQGTGPDDTYQQEDKNNTNSCSASVPCEDQRNIKINNIADHFLQTSTPKFPHESNRVVNHIRDQLIKESLSILESIKKVDSRKVDIENYADFIRKQSDKELVEKYHTELEKERKMDDVPACSLNQEGNPENNINIELLDKCETRLKCLMEDNFMSEKDPSESLGSMNASADVSCMSDDQSFDKNLAVVERTSFQWPKLVPEMNPSLNTNNNSIHITETNQHAISFEQRSFNLENELDQLQLEIKKSKEILEKHEQEMSMSAQDLDQQSDNQDSENKYEVDAVKYEQDSPNDEISEPDNQNQGQSKNSSVDDSNYLSETEENVNSNLESAAESFVSANSSNTTLGKSDIIEKILELEID
jgi:hypothetical protein